MSIDKRTFQNAVGALNLGKLREAETLFRRVLKAEPRHVGALNLLAVVLMRLERFADAEEFIRAALKINHSSDASFYNYGLILAGLGRPQGALEQFNRALEINPKVRETWHSRGTTFSALRQHQNAIADFDRAITLSPNYHEAFYSKGNSFGEIRHYHEALIAYDQALTLKPDLMRAWLGRGNMLLRLKRPDEAFAAYNKVLALKPDLPEAWLGLGNAWFARNRMDEASAAYDKALTFKPDLAEAWLGRGNVGSARKHFDEAFASYDKALAIRADLAEAWLGRANALCGLKRWDEAIAAYDKALAIESDLAEAWLGRANALFELNLLDDASAAYDKALALKPDQAWLGLGNVLYERKHLDEASSAYENALARKPDSYAAWLGLGNASLEIKRYDAAFAAYDKALALKPDLAEAWLGYGNAFVEMRRYEEAISAYDKALALRPDLAEPWGGLGNALFELKRLDEAFVAYDKALKLNPDLSGLEGNRLYAKAHLCDWKNLDAERENLVSAVRSGKTRAAPFPFLVLTSSAEEQRKCSELWVANICPAAKPVWKGEHYDHDRIRLAYLSADFHQHATSNLIAGLFECHDKSRFEVTAISWGPDDNSNMRQRMAASFESFIDAATQTEKQIAILAKDLEIDILVDLKGFTTNSRPGIFARRPAPIQVSWLGYPGTMGASYIDYIIADEVVIPESHRKFFAEKIAFLPNSYQVNDTQRSISEKILTRAEMGLPPEGFVFCCFNNNYKITPTIFDRWMRILKNVAGSVLWLLEDNAHAASNLRQEAAARGVDADRLIFAKRIPLAEHLARHRSADVFLDTLPCNAHTTASDALWAGLPVLTCPGGAFAGRVAASLMHAMHLPELISSTLEDYEALATQIATHPNKLKQIKLKLARHRLTTPLFNTGLFTKHIEAAYIAMHERHRADLAPDHIFISE